jgi:FtsP/CotA-like multicopper oxidase with cupredoxin domain
MLNRREFLVGTGAAAFAVSNFGRTLLAASSPRTLSIEARQIEVKGRAAKAYRLADSRGRAGLQFIAGEEFAVKLQNKTDVASLIHWHGLTPPYQQDGVPEVSQPALPPGASYAYRFILRLTGTHWMHSHVGLQEQQLMAAPLIIGDPAEAALDRQEVIILLHDFSFRDPQEILADLRENAGSTGMGAMNPSGSSMGGMNMGGASMSGMDMSSMSHGEMQMDLNDVEFDAFLANDRTLEDPEVVAVEKGGHVRLRIINGAAATNFTLDVGDLAATLIAVDGNRIQSVRGRRFPLAIAQRVDLMLEIPRQGGAFPILALQEGTTARTGLILASRGAHIKQLASNGQAKGPVLGLDLETGLRAAVGLSQSRADRRIPLLLEGNMQSYRWTFDGHPHGQHAPLSLKEGERVELSLQNATMMSHPIHLHGHHFQVVGIGGRRMQGAVRDTVLVPPMQTVEVAFDADNPGKWVMHCHQLYHMAAGMMVELHYEGFA